MATKKREDDADAVRKEMQQVKTRAVQKIRTLQTQVDGLTKELSELKQRQPSPPESASSEDSDTVTVSSPTGAEIREAELRRRERELKEREEALSIREEALSMREGALNASREAGGGDTPTMSTLSAAALLTGLGEIHKNLAQVELLVEAVAVG